MEDTENYLNNILKKRMASVQSYSLFAKNANTVTRLPVKQQKLESMPTVFRNKTDTIFRKTGVMPSEVIPIGRNSMAQLHKTNKENDGQNQRVQYMAISKRLQRKKQELIAPTVDVSKYRTTNYIPPSNIIYQSKSQQQNCQHLFKFHKNQQQNIATAMIKNIKKVEQDEIIIKQALLKATTVSRKDQFNRKSYASKRKKIFMESCQRSRLTLL